MRFLLAHSGRFLVAAGLIVTLAAPSGRADQPPQAAVDFTRQVRPILADNCFQCHGPDEATRQVELRLDTHEGAFAQRPDGAPIVPGDPARSLLYQRISAESEMDRMPPPQMTDKKLSAEQIVVSDDADFLAGKPVEGPFTAYAQAEVINDHALEASGGLTYAQLDQDDPVRQTVMTASFLRASLFTSIVSFGVAVFAFGIGILMILIGWALLRIEKSLRLTPRPT